MLAVKVEHWLLTFNEGLIEISITQLLCVSVCFYVFTLKTRNRAYDGDMAKVTVTLYIEEDDKEALQKLAEAEERSLSQMAVLILKQRLKPAQDEGKSRQLKVQGRNDAIFKQPGVSDSSAQYRTNSSELKPKGNVRLTAAYLQPHELQELAERIVELENAAAGSDLKFKVQIELHGAAQLSEEAMARLKEILQEITEDFKL
ncbi:hypothetical protein WA1_20325 [Scytonema hofmannii PCC 7110]|uniref:Uncharacterized protein n=1 Tax=Scytonema hofmannii PCC 7110 TaxID=128403 RepID=A0A139XCH7_9CYAN|nr:ribbon-helix-helix protein, CopG family [Scytonema hofmannii]KYC42322.1 hypothetical protein WA1_20325 [Scytonema hofmannii PCC 7110]